MDSPHVDVIAAFGTFRKARLRQTASFRKLTAAYAAPHLSIIWGCVCACTCACARACACECVSRMPFPVCVGLMLTWTSPKGCCHGHSSGRCGHRCPLLLRRTWRSCRAPSQPPCTPPARTIRESMRQRSSSAASARMTRECMRRKSCNY